MAKRTRRFLTPTHASQMLGLGAARVCQLFDSGELRGVRDSAGRRLIDEDSVKQLARQRQVSQEKSAAVEAQ